MTYEKFPTARASGAGDCFWKNFLHDRCVI